MELVNFIGASPSQDGKWLLVTFARKGTDEKFRWIVPYNVNVPHYANGALPVSRLEDNRYYITLAIASIAKKEEPKEEPKEEHEPLEEDIPF